MFQSITDLECNRCHGIYKSNERGMSVMMQHCYLAICPSCTQEVATLMGFTPENITKELANIRRADTEQNRLQAIEQGDVCKGCEKSFLQKEPRVRLNNASNILAWHIECYEKEK